MSPSHSPTVKPFKEISEISEITSESIPNLTSESSSSANIQVEPSDFVTPQRSRSVPFTYGSLSTGERRRLFTSIEDDAEQSTSVERNILATDGRLEMRKERHDEVNDNESEDVENRSSTFYRYLHIHIYTYIYLDLFILTGIH